MFYLVSKFYSSSLLKPSSFGESSSIGAFSIARDKLLYIPIELLALYFFLSSFLLTPYSPIEFISDWFIFYEKNPTELFISLC